MSNTNKIQEIPQSQNLDLIVRSNDIVGVSVGSDNEVGRLSGDVFERLESES